MRYDIDRILGLNLQPGKKRPGELLVADNIALLPGGAVERRPALRYRLTLPAAAHGLFPLGRTLNCVVPNATDTSNLAPTIRAWTLDSSLGITGLRGVIGNATGVPLLLVEHDNGLMALYLGDIETLRAYAVSLPFSPAGVGLVKAGTRAFAVDQDRDGVLRHSAVDHPDYPDSLHNWNTDRADEDGNALDTSLVGGRILVGQHSSGSPQPTALVEYDGHLAACFPTSIQVWRVGAELDDLFLDKNPIGPGVNSALGVTQVGTDLAFITPALAIQLLSRAEVTQEAEEGHLGTAIEPLIKALYSELIDPRIFFARSRSQLLLVMDNHVLALGIRPGEGIFGWAHWIYPVAIDDIIESDKTVWIQSGQVLYSLDDTIDFDEVAVGDERPIAVHMEFCPCGGEDPSRKTLHRISTTTTEPSKTQIVTDGRPSCQDDGSLPDAQGSYATLDARSPDPVAMTTCRAGQSFGLRIHDEAASASWRCDQVFLEMTPTAPRGP